MDNYHTFLVWHFNGLQVLSYGVDSANETSYEGFHTSCWLDFWLDHTFTLDWLIFCSWN